MGALVACSSGGTDGTGGAGGESGEGGDMSSSTTSTTSTSSTMVTSSSTGGGPQLCDDQGLECESPDGMTPGCLDCAIFEGTCGDEYADCGEFEDPENTCTQVNECLAACPEEDMACPQACFEANPDGTDLFLALYTCLLCDECPVTCESADTPLCGG